MRNPPHSRGEENVKNGTVHLKNRRGLTDYDGEILLDGKDVDGIATKDRTKHISGDNNRESLLPVLWWFGAWRSAQ